MSALNRAQIDEYVAAADKKVGERVDIVMSSETEIAVDLSFIVCAYNEVSRIEKGVLSVLHSFGAHPESAEVILIDNCSSDGTREWIENFRHPKVRSVLNERNLGKGGSIREGILAARGRYFVVFDPDLEYDVEDAWTCYSTAVRNSFAGVLGSRTIGGTPNFHYFANYIGVVFLTKLINLFFGARLTDAATATKLFETRRMQRTSFQSTGFDFDFELVTRCLMSGGKIAEISARYFPRTVAEGKKIRAIRDGLAALWVILRDAVQYRVMKSGRVEFS